ncbi:MAG: hypothetical protein U5L11_00280 [Arhodomonas sp.]|nr:hypothetical protein [Arhodomonas sp.]
MDHLTASGCLIPADAWHRLGPMDESFFIDYVDVEWGLRAARAGLRCYGVCDAHMEHPLGEAPARALGRRVVTHPPARNYYFFRNGVRLIRSPDLRPAWRFCEARRLALRFAFYLVFGHPRLQHLSHILRGIHHGWRGISGPDSPPTT